MEGEGAPVGRPPDVGQGEERPAEAPPVPILHSAAAPSPPRGQAKSTPQAGMDPLPESGTPNLGFVEDPPPYSPPDPKAAHLLYPAFQANVPGRGLVFYQPAPLPQATAQQPNLLPFAIYNSALFHEIPTEAERRNLPKAYMVESVLVTIFCCFLTGVAALVYSHETRSALNRGDFAQAKASSERTRLLVVFSLAFGVFVSISWVVYVVATLYL